MRLPAQIRGDIFEYLFLMWDPNEPYCSTQRNGVHVGLARLKTKSQDLFYDPWNAPGIFEQSFGMLDYFKRGEYYNILRFTKALVRFEGREDEIEGMPIGDPSKAENRKLGVLKDFMDWFWRSTMLCMHREPFNNPLQWFNCHPEFYDHIQNLSLSYAPRRSYWPEYDNERARPPYTPMNWHVCKIIGEKLHNLNNLLLLVELPFGIIQRCITKRRIYPWMKLVRKLSIRERFEVRLEVSGLEFLQETSAWNLRQQEKYRLEGEIALRDLTLPDCLRRVADDFDDGDFGTERLFGGSEDG